MHPSGTPIQRAFRAACRRPEFVRIFLVEASRCRVKAGQPMSICHDRRGPRSRYGALERLKLALNLRFSHVSAGSKPLKSVLRLLVLSARATLRDSRISELFNDLRDVSRIRLDRLRARGATQAPITHPFSGKVETNHWNAFPVDILPDVHLSPVQQWMNTNMCSGIKIGFELVPQFRRLIFEIPFEV